MAVVRVGDGGGRPYGGPDSPPSREWSEYLRSQQPVELLVLEGRELRRGVAHLGRLPPRDVGVPVLAERVEPHRHHELPLRQENDVGGRGGVRAAPAGPEDPKPRVLGGRPSVTGRVSVVARRGSGPVATRGGGGRHGRMRPPEKTDGPGPESGGRDDPRRSRRGRR